MTFWEKRWEVTYNWCEERESIESMIPKVMGSRRNRKAHTSPCM